MPEQTSNTPSNRKAVKIGNVTISERLVIILEDLKESDEKGVLKDQIARHAFWLVRSDISEEFNEDTKEIIGYCHKLYDIVSELEKGGDNV